MVGKPKTVEIFGVRPQVWLGMVAAMLGLTVLYRTVEDEAMQEIKTPSLAQKTPQFSASRSAAPTVREAGLRVGPGELPVENIVLVTEGRENEPLPVLINELFSPDPETRMAAAARLSRRSLQASEAVPVLKQLSEDEQDPKVREVMKEAILNIRGFVPAPFEASPEP